MHAHEAAQGENELDEYAWTEADDLLSAVDTGRLAVVQDVLKASSCPAKLLMQPLQVLSCAFLPEHSKERAPFREKQHRRRSAVRSAQPPSRVCWPPLWSPGTLLRGSSRRMEVGRSTMRPQLALSTSAASSFKTVAWRWTQSPTQAVGAPPSTGRRAQGRRARDGGGWDIQPPSLLKPKRM